MGKKPTYAELQRRVAELEKLAVTYSQAKASLKQTLEKHPGLEEKPSGPEMAVDVLDQHITEQKPVEQALIAEHIFRKTIEKSVPCGIAAMDRNGRQTYVNQFFCDMIGWRPNELVGKRYPYAYLPQERLEGYQKYFSRSFVDTASHKSVELRFVRKSAERFWALVQTAALHGSDGRHIGLLMSVVDIDKQKNAEEKLRALSSRLIDARENERKHISTELHDSIGGKLTGIKYSLEKALYDVQRNRMSPVKPLQETLRIVQDTIEEAQRITKNLHPSIIDDLGILSAIKSYCREFQAIYTNIRIEQHFDFKETLIPESLKILIYRVMQEALNNIAKHSEADRIEITLEQQTDRIVLTIGDNGRGFDLAAVLRDDTDHGMGLRSMSEKTELFGGSLDIRTRPGQGTRIEAAWPYGGS